MLIDTSAPAAIPSLPFPGAELSEETEARSHRRLTLPGSSLRGAWTNNGQFFESDAEAGVLKCNHVWWLEISGNIPHVPAGRWEVELLLRHGGISLRKQINWFLHVDGGGVRSTVQLVTGQNAPLEFNVRGEWVYFRMGTITVRNPDSSFRLSIQGFENTMVSDLSFGGLVLKPSCTDWRREAILLRSAFRNVTMEEEPANTTSFLCLPQSAVVLVAQYLITPMPHETRLL